MATKMATKKKPTVRGLTVALRKATELTRFTKEELDLKRQLVHEVVEEAKAGKRKLNAAQHDLCRYANATLLERIKFLFKRF